ncbi:MAG: hypothetical protein J6S85_26155 [Methanobrevibacter sp.]|nr:hypothetical protein [Methanobrevibacter sp.]MBO7717076.1 hypothetical protein [Methanobrevibacter sp.]
MQVQTNGGLWKTFGAVLLQEINTAKNLSLKCLVIVTSKKENRLID